MASKISVNESERATENPTMLNRALSASGLGVWEWVVETKKLTWTDKLKEIYGLSPSEDITYARYLTLVHPDDLPCMRKTIQQALREGKSYSAEHRVIWPDGSVHWVLGQGQAFMKNNRPICMIGTSMIIDERKATEQQLLESEQRFRSIADTAPVLIWMTNARMKNCYYNKSWLDFTGRSLEKEIALGWVSNLHPDDRSKCQQRYAEQFKKREPISLEYRFRRHDGEYRWLLDNGQPRFDHAGKFLGYVGSCMDIHDIKFAKQKQNKLEEFNSRLRSQRTQLVALHRSKDEFISLASHQLRTPATGVKQYIGMLLEGYVGNIPKEQIHVLRTAYESNERQLNIIDDLLRVAQIDAGKVTLKKSTTDIVRLLKDVIEEQSDKFHRRKQSINFNYDAQRICAVIDPERIRMVLENLIDNASKYTPEGKHISVALSQCSGNVVICIKDNGVGIAKQDLPLLFQKFTRINNSLSTRVGGTGLGLYWADKIISLHGGKIAVKSRIHKGSEFKLTIPLE